MAATTDPEYDTPLTDAALALKLGYPRAHRKMLLGELDGRRDASGRWRVTSASVERLRARLAASEATAPVDASKEDAVPAVA
jgi:hypothetical protein